MTPRILLISDDEPSESLGPALAGKGYRVTVLRDADDGYRQMVKKPFDLVVISLDRAITGAGLIRRIRANTSLKQQRVLTIAEWGTGGATIALAQGADAFEPKPVETDRLLDAIERLLRPSMVKSARVSTTHVD